MAHRDGILSTASLMVAAPAAADAVARARRLPGLRVGLHLVLVDGAAVLPPAEVPRLVGAQRPIRRKSARAGFRYFFSPGSASPAGGGDPRPVRGVPRHRPRARPCQRAQAYPPAPDGGPADPGDRPRLRHARGAAAGRAGRGAAPRLPGRARRRAALCAGDRGAAAAPAARRDRLQRPCLRHRLERRHDRGAGTAAAALSAGRDQRNLFPSRRPGRTPALEAGDARLSPSPRSWRR